MAQSNLAFYDTAANPFAQRPGFPATFFTPPKAAASKNNGDGAPINGNDFILKHGYNNRAGESCPDGYIIAPGGNDDLAWAQYSVGSFNTKRPVKVKIGVTGVIAPGGNDDLPLIYWVGISDYTTGSWTMSGPYTKSVQITVNSDQWSHRCVSKTNELQVLILTDATGIKHDENNPEGITSVEIISLEAVASNRYKCTAPILPYDTVLTYDPSQYSVDLSWTHLVDTSNAANEAQVYTVTRLQVSTGTTVVVGTTTAPDALFTDPVDAAAGVPALIPGETYKYFVKAENTLATEPVLIGEVTI